MAVGLKEIKRRIKTVNNTWKITKAMEMVAAARLKKIQNKLYHYRNYHSKLEEIVNSVLSEKSVTSPLLAESGEISKKISLCVIVISADRGLCGSYNSNIFRKIIVFLEENKSHKIYFYILGKKAMNFISKRIKQEDIEFYPSVEYNHIEELSKKIIEKEIAKKFDEVFIIYTKFISPTKHQVTVEKILPIDRDLKKEYIFNFILEPEIENIVKPLLQDYIISKIYKYYLESQTSEQSARMIAMQQANKNALEMIDRLTLLFNKERQSLITKEILEVVSGAEALK